MSDYKILYGLKRLELNNLQDIFKMQTDTVSELEFENSEKRRKIIELNKKIELLTVANNDLSNDNSNKEQQIKILNSKVNMLTKDLKSMISFLEKICVIQKTSNVPHAPIRECIVAMENSDINKLSEDCRVEHVDSIPSKKRKLNTMTKIAFADKREKVRV